MTTTEGERGQVAATGLLANKVCIVSGVGPGLGRQAARALVSRRAKPKERSPRAGSPEP